MTLAKLAEELTASAKAEGHVTLDSAVFEKAGLVPPANLDALVTRSFQEPKLVLATTPDQIGQASETQLTITGSLTALGVTDVKSTVVFTAAGTAVSFTLEAPLPSDWTLATSFSGLAGFPFESVKLTQPAYLFSTGKVSGYAWPGGAVDLEAGLNLASFAVVGGSLAPLLALVPGAPAKPLLHGTIDPGAGSLPSLPDVDLEAKMLEGAMPDIGFLELSDADLGLVVRTQATTTGKEQYPSGYLSAVVGAAGTELKLACRIEAKKSLSTLRLAVGPPEGEAVTIPDVFALMGGRTWYSTIPAPLQALFTSIGFKGLEAEVTTVDGKPQLNSISATVGSTAPWPLFANWQIDSVDFLWSVVDPLGEAEVTGEFGGTAHFYPELFTEEFYASVDTDMLVVAGYDGKITLSRVLELMSPGTVLPAHMDVSLANFQTTIESSRNAFSLGAIAEASMDILGNGTLQLLETQLFFASAPNSTRAGLDGSLVIGGTVFALEATYENGAWHFDGGLKPGQTIQLGALVDDLLEGIGLPGFVPETLEVAPLWLTVDVPGEPQAKGTYHLVAGTTWRLDAPGSVLDGLELGADVDLTYTGKTTGLISGEAKLPLPIAGMTFDVTLAYEMATENELLWAEWHGFAKATYSLTKDEVTFQLKESSLGSLLTDLVRIIEGEPKFTLPAPWNLLEQISLKAFSVVWRLDPEKGQSPVEVKYDFEGNNIDLYFIEIESLGFTVKDGKVQISLSAKLLGETDFKEMEFPATDPPPAPGQDSTAFELDLLALGQRVSVQGLKEATKVAEATKVLESFKPPKEGNALPVPANPEAGQPYYEPESAWLVGTRFKVLVDKQTGVALLLLEAVFNDPQLYGIRLALGGAKAGPLEGLEFEILYRKVSDTVGVYQIELTLPKSMRQLQLGAVAVTLPVVGVQIYTNGDFRIDFGFPANMDFSRSAGVEAFPFLGQGGFYFGALSSQTAGENVPATTRGTFDPVYVFGLGLRIGLGKSLDEGIFSAELSVTVFGIVEGVLAMFNPNEQASGKTALPATVGAEGTAIESQYYWWLQGTVGLIGKVEGTVNFAIISASVNVTVQALIQFTVEAHRAIPVHVEAGVSVGITVKINLGLFSIRLHFSFNLTVKADFLIGSDTEAPWDPPALFAARRSAAPLPPPSPRTFAPLAVEAKIPLDVYAAPQLTLADWTTEPAPQAAYVAMLYLEIPVGESSPTPTAFEQLARETLLWALTNFGEATGVGRGEALASEVTRRQVEEAYAHFAATGGPPPVSWTEIREFLDAHFELSVVEPPSGGLESAGAMPMLPDLTLQIPAWEGSLGRTVDFATEATCGSAYLDALQKLLAELEVQLQTELEKKHASEKQATPAGEIPEQSLATFIAEDWFALLCRYMLQSSLDAFDSYAYVLPGEQSLEEIVDTFPGNGLTVEAVGAANAGLPLAPKAAISISGVTHTVAVADTLGKIAAEYGLQAVDLVEANPELQGLLVEGAELTLKGKPYRVGPRDTFAKIGNATGASSAEVAAAVSAAGEGALVTLAALAVPRFSHEAAADGTDTLTSLSGRYGVDVTAIAAANAKTRPLFEYEAGKTFVDVPGLTTMSAALLTEELHGSQVYANLAGISTRFLLDGLRLPEIDDASQTRGLQSLTGQQVTLPKLEDADAGKYALTLGRGAEGGWIKLGADGKSLPMTIDQKQIEWINSVLAGAIPAIEPDTISIAAMPATAGVKRQFNLNAASPLRLPAGLALPGEKAAAPSLLLMPDALLTVLADPDRARPAFSLQRADPGPGGVPVVKPVSSSSWGTVVSVIVKRIPDAPAGSYELSGTDQTGIVLLERLLEQIGTGSNPIFGTPQVLFPPAATDPQPTGLIGGDPATVSAYVVQANLSTETNPQRLAATRDVSEAATKTVVNTAEEFVRLLWECSIVASGGYYFHYESAPGSPGLPDYLFNPHGEATFQVLIQLEGQGEGLGRYVNAAVVGESIDPARTTVFAQSEPRAVERVLAEADSLASIAAGLHLTVPELAVQLADVPLKPSGPQLAIEWVDYETRAGDTLAGIANAFRTTPAAIEAANADLRIDWGNLPPWTLLWIPPVTTAVGAGGPATLGEVAAAFSLDVETLGWLNQDVSGIFKVTGSPIQIVDEIVDATAVLPPSVAGFTVERRRLEAPASDEVALYLDSTFNLLGWQLVENAGFRASPSGLPVSPGEPMDQEELAQLRAERPAPQASTGGGTLVYEQLFPVTSYAKDVPQAGDEHVPPAAADPYAGIGFAAQPRLEWRDLFGNRARTPLTEPALDPNGPANQPPVPIAYADRLLGLGQWPGAGATYTVGKGGEGSQIEVSISFETHRYEGGGEAAQQLAEADRETYATAYYQLNQEGIDRTPHVTVELTTTLDDGKPHVLAGAALESVKEFVLAAWQYLDDLVSHLEGRLPAAPAPPPNREFAVAVADTNPADIFELTVSLALVRDPRLVAAESRGEDGVARVEAVLVAVGATADETASLLPFAEAFEKTFEAPPVVVKLAVGTSREEEADAAGAHRLWVVRTSEDLSAGIGARVSGKAWYYAPPPLATALASRNGVKVPVFEAGKGIVSEVPRDFTDVDLDVWAREALQAIDGVLSPATAVPAFVVDSVAGTTFLERLREAKKTLAKAISGRVVNVLEAPAEDPEGLLAARERWEQQLLVSLSSAYQTDVAVQLPVEVHSGGEGEFLPPELYGHISMPEEQAKYCTATTFKIGTAKEKGYLTFMFAASDPTARSSVHVDAGYALDMIEHEISGVPGIEGYRASSWLSFPIPLGSLPLGKPEFGSLDVPVVLRAYPTPPTLGKQGTRPDLDATSARTAVETAARWTFLADYDQIHVAQDVIDAEAEFNIPGAAGALAAEARAEDMFEALARLLGILPQLQTVFETQLAGLTTQTPKESPDFVASEEALAAFTGLVERVAALWGVLNPDPTSSGVESGGGTRFDIEEAPYDAEGEDDLLVTVEEGQGQPGVPSPAIEIEGFEGVPTGEGLRYREAPSLPYLSYKDGQKIPGRTVAIGPLDGFTLQNARLGLQITRNADLVAGNPTRTPFVYTTPMVRFPSVCTPLLNVGQSIDVAAVATGSRRRATLAEHLQSLFSTLFATAPDGVRSVQFQASYRLPMEGDPSLPPSVLPILLGPAVEFDVPGGWEKGGFAEKAAESLREWLRGHDVAADAELGFEISVFSSLAGTALPTVRLAGLYLRLADVTGA